MSAALGEKDRIVALGASAVSANVNFGSMASSRFHLPTRLVEPAQMRKAGGEKEERHGPVPVGVDRFSEPGQGFGKFTNKRFRDARNQDQSKIIASRGLRRKASRNDDFRLPRHDPDIASSSGLSATASAFGHGGSGGRPSTVRTGAKERR